MTSDRASSTEAGQPADEVRLVRRAQGGDRLAMEELARRFRPRLVHLLGRRTGRWADADDIAQQALLRAFERIDQHDGRRPFSTWLYRIAWRMAVDLHRRPRPEPGLDCNTLCDPRGRDPQDAAADAELRQNLWSIARRVLSADQYCVLWLRYAEDMSINDVARVLRRTRISVRVLLHRARRRLAPHLVSLVDAERVEVLQSEPTPLESQE